MAGYLLRALIVVALSLTACGPDENNNNTPTNNNVADMGGMDTGGGEDATNVDPNNGNPDMAADMPVDMAPVDSDGDGILDPDDNCPDIENPEQLDRDRDGLGDDCDDLMYVYDPSNPATVANTVMEDETAMSNDTAVDGLEYGLSLPFVARGTVGDVDNPGDLDFYSFEVDRPTLVLMRLTASPSMWAGAIVLGMDWANNNVFRVEVSPDVGISSDRELFLPFPGRYTIAMSDARNFIASQPDVGGAGLQYNLSISEVPIPDPEPVTLPSPAISGDFDGVTKVFEVDVDGIDGLRATSTGVPQDQNSFYQPALVFYDPDAEQSVAINSGSQSADDLIATLGLNLKDRQRLWVIEDFAQRFGQSSSRVEFASEDLSMETETLAAPADVREADVQWLEVGESISATIGQPRAAGPTTLVGDEDFFFFSAKRGETIRITVTPDAGSMLEPLLEMANLPEQVGFPITLHESEDRAVGETASVEFVMTAYVEGEIVAYVQHGPNQFASNPVGGPAYGYTVTAEVITPTTSAISAVPGSTQVEFEPGGIGIATFDATAGQILTASEESNLFSDIRIIDPATWRVLAEGSNALTFGPPADGEYWVEIRDIIGRGTDGTPSMISVDALVPSPLGALPGTVSATLDMQPRHLYTFTGSAGDRLDIRVNAPNFFAAIDLYDGTFQPVGGRYYQDRQLVLPADGEYVVGVSSSGGSIDPGYDYTLGVEVIPAATRQLPFAESGTFDDVPFATWYEVPVVAGTIYSAGISSAEPAFLERVTVFRAADLSYIKGSVSGAARWTAEEDGMVLIAVEDDSNNGGPSFDFSLSVGELATTPAIVGQASAEQLPTGSDEDVFTFTLATGAMIDLQVNATGDWRPQLRLLNGASFDPIGEASQIGNTVRYAVSEGGDYAVSVRSTDGTIAGPLDYTLTVSLVDPAGAIAEAEPNDTQADAQDPGASPAVVSASVLGADVDRFRFPLIRGQRMWAMATDRNMNGADRFDARLYLRDPADTELRNFAYSGEGFMPAAYGYEVPNSGEYQWAYQARTGGNADGDYFIYFVAGPSSEVAEAEPNNDPAGAQQLGSFVGPVRIAAFVDPGDTVDVFAVDLAASDGRIRASLENAGPGHELRLLDSGGTPLASSGVPFDGLTDPALDTSGLAAGRYYVEFSTGSASGAADLIVIVD